ncbi:hypothetical protein ABZT03_08795 [Streptomyces sp. NPDC005574]
MPPGDPPPHPRSWGREPGGVFDMTTDLSGVPAGYQDVADGRSLKVLVKN